jgi:adenylosuccinate synthase
MAEVVLIAGLGFGDEGKGTTVDWLASTCPRTKLVVRYNGGAQAAHNVVRARGRALVSRHHTFAQFGSATFSGVPTLLSRHMLVNPVALVAEARHLESTGVSDPFSLLHVEEDALVTTPLHLAMNRLREMARTGRHGSCGMGIGETMEEALSLPDDVLRVRDLADLNVAHEKLVALRERKLPFARGLAGEAPSDAQRRELGIIEDDSMIERCLEYHAAFVRQVRIVDGSFLADVLRRSGQVLFEGAQGVLLDQDFGFQPHTTWTNITFDNARSLLDDAGFTGRATKLGILRAYATRHGVGPFVTEDRTWDLVSSHDHNRTGDWQGSFRSGAFDLVATRYALDVLSPRGVDALVMTNVDRLSVAPTMGASNTLPVCTEYAGEPTPEYFEGQNRRIAGIRIHRPFSLDHQEVLTRALFDVKPVYEAIPRRGYAAAIAERLGVPLAAVSTGPTAADKRIVRPRMASAGAVAVWDGA